MGKLSTFIIAVLVFSIVVTGLHYVITTEFDYYGQEVESNYEEIFGNVSSSIDETGGLVEEIQNRTQSAEGISTTFSFIMATQLIFKAIKLPFEAIGIVSNLLFGIGREIGIPSFILGGLFSIILVVVTFLVLKAVLKTEV